MLACVIIVGAIQMFFYNLLPTSIPIILTAIGLIARPPDDPLFLATQARKQAARLGRARAASMPARVRALGA